MNRQILFEGKVTLGDQLVDFRIYKNMEEDIITHYSFEINPEVRDVNQAGFHNGDTQRGEDLEGLLFRFRQFQGEFSKIVETRKNENY